MERFLNKKVVVVTSMGGTYGAGDIYKGVFTSYDDKFICLNGKIFISNNFVMTIEIK